MDAETEAYILLLLADGNLPTGSFVTSSGLESYIKHGFFTSVIGHTGLNTSPKPSANTIGFIRQSLHSYAQSSLPFVSDAHRLVSNYVQATTEGTADALQMLGALDTLYESTMLNPVARRASTAQGVALLTLYSKGFSRPAALDSISSNSPVDGTELAVKCLKLIDELKLLIRKGVNPGHLPVCWGVITATLGLNRSQHLYLFLHARGLLSAAIRLNTIGPYAAQQLLLHALKPIVEGEVTRCANLQAGFPAPSVSEIALGTCDKTNVKVEAFTTGGPAMTWPLGEILTARHDLQHSRIFNS